MCFLFYYNTINFDMPVKWRQWHPNQVLLTGGCHAQRSLVGCSRGVAKSRTRLSDFNFTFHFHALEKEMATHSSVLAWRIPGTGEPVGLLPMGLHRVRHDWSDLAAAVKCSLIFFEIILIKIIIAYSSQKKFIFLMTWNTQIRKNYFFLLSLCIFHICCIWMIFLEGYR